MKNDPIGPIGGALPVVSRKIITDEIERLISVLDELDRDPDFEPYLAGYSEGTDDRESDDSDLEDGADTEHSLGWTENIDERQARMVHSGWVFGDGEGEPLLGWCENHGCGFTAAQEGSSRDDREWDVADEGEMEDEL
ncbi:hypothetical protein [Jiella sp. M17.18]|uniref:hypothetical protein n=1 Tax=Jiella sp. M17.18 TaxID=3234247 RepID=UPI0034DFD398